MVDQVATQTDTTSPSDADGFGNENVPPDVSELPNRYAELERSYRLGYTEGAFGDHSPTPPAELTGERQSVWKDGFGEGLQRHEIYKRGFRAGVETVLTNAGPPSEREEDLSPDQESAWQFGYAAGTAWASSVLNASGNGEEPHQRVPTSSRDVTDADIPPEAASPFFNPYTNRAHAYRAGYMYSAFGVLSDEDWASSEFADQWEEGSVDGYARLKAYKLGFRDGVETKLARVRQSAVPADLQSDQAEAWKLGQLAGMAKADAVEGQIRRKAMSMPGYALSDRSIGSKRESFGWAYWQEFGSDQCIYLEAHESSTEDTVTYKSYALGSQIYPKYRELGHWDGFLGPPVADTTIVSDGSGWMSKFHGGEMYWSQDTGANALAGKILKHWKSLGGVRSYLRYPTSNTSPLDVDRGTITTFQGGDIYKWDDAPAPFDLRGVRITYAGMNCFGDTDEAMSDEPYPIFTVLKPKRRLENGQIVRQEGTSILGPEESALGGGSYARDMLLYEGAPAEVGGIAVVLMEYDDGDKNAYRADVEAAVTSLLVGATGFATGVGGPALGALVGWLAQTGGPAIVSAINSALGTDDEVIGKHVHIVTPRQLIDMARAHPMREQDIAAFKFGHHQLLSGHDATYKVYFNVTFV